METNVKPNMHVNDKAIGRIKGEGIVKVSVSLEWRDRLTETVDHEQIEGYWRFSVMGSVWRRSNSPDCHSAGQIIGAVARLNTDISARIVKLWRKWHLNDMNAGCAHQLKPVIVDGRQDLNSVTPCPETGYRYSRAWLLREIPDDVLTEIREIIAEIEAL